MSRIVTRVASMPYDGDWNGLLVALPAPRLCRMCAYERACVRMPSAAVRQEKDHGGPSPFLNVYLFYKTPINRLNDLVIDLARVNPIAGATVARDFVAQVSVQCL